MKKMSHRTILFSLGLCLIGFLSGNVFPQDRTEGGQGKMITVDKEVWASPYKSQGSGGSCSIHSVVSFLESEIYRTDQKKIELSQLYCHYYSYIEKAQQCLRFRDHNSFRKGGHFGDVLRVIKKYGAMPYAVYEGTLKKEDINNYKSLFNGLQQFIRELSAKAQKNELDITWKNGIVTNPWLQDLKGLLDTHMGVFPEMFTYNGQEYTPEKFADRVLNLNFNDCVKLTSYSYIPFYQPGELLVRDNWLHDHDFYNLPIDDYIRTIDHAINHGYSAAMDIHITRELYADTSRNYADFREDEIIDQDVRDELFDNWQTSDVHLIHLIGIAHDESGKKYYVVKDSVGEELEMHPPAFYSENYFRGRVLAVMIHKNGIPKDIRKKL
jgi:bleomycin hydrolase